MEPTSEQELKQLLDEGKITEEEYKELLEAIRQKETMQKPVEKPNEPKPRTGYGKAALIMFVLSVALPILGILLSLVLNMIGVKILLAAPFVLIGLLCGLLAFIFGIIGWKSTQGKIAAIGVPGLGLLVVPGLLLLSLFSVRAAHSSISGQLETLRSVCHKHYPLDSTTNVLTQDGVEFDEISTDGNGSLKITSDSPDKKVIRLFETGPIEIEDCILTYSAKIRTEKLYGKTYLEMWCDIPGKGEFFSRGLEQSISGTTDWTITKILFRLEPGQRPANIKLNLVREGTGTVWIDDIKLLSNPLD